MSCRSFRQPVRICNPQGLHMRPAAAFATLARSFTATVTVWSHEQSVNGKSFIDLIMLAAECGTELVLEVSGDDAESALAALADLLAAENLDDAT